MSQIAGGVGRGHRSVPIAPYAFENATGYTEGTLMRWLSNLFGGGTVELEYPDNGKLVKKRVSRVQFDSMMCNAVAEGIATAHQACVAHILDAFHGERTEKWIVGEHMLPETYHRYKGPNGELYVMYENGEPQMELLNKHNKQLWCQAASQFAATGSANEEASRQDRRDLLALA